MEGKGQAHEDGQRDAAKYQVFEVLWLGYVINVERSLSFDFYRFQRASGQSYRSTRESRNYHGASRRTLSTS